MNELIMAALFANQLARQTQAAIIIQLRNESIQEVLMMMGMKMLIQTTVSSSKMSFCPYNKKGEKATVGNIKNLFTQ